MLSGKNIKLFNNALYCRGEDKIAVALTGLTGLTGLGEYDVFRFAGRCRQRSALLLTPFQAFQAFQGFHAVRVGNSDRVKPGGIRMYPAMS
jgi:hypothetical protein